MKYSMIFLTTFFMLVAVSFPVLPGRLVIAHNMRYPSPDPDYIEAITQNPVLETMFLLMHGAGMGVTMKKR
ncbi:hypothetical protein ACG2F4_05730 [Halalkalibaculum sp. DA3122]|uniref:hypothetical protein n=1 Tax=unclassified Halalkalibaculum TaxID=2964617 RepID=UPI003754B730